MKVYFRIIFIKGNVAISVIFIASEARWSFLRAILLNIVYFTLGIYIK